MFSDIFYPSSPQFFFSPISLSPKLSPTFLSLSTYTSFSRFTPYCQPCHLPIPALHSRVRSSVLTLGFVQICSLRDWKVVMRAKKNSLAQSLTTMLVFLMKPNENSIFYPCYSLPPILHPSLPAWIPPSPPLAPLICRLISYSCLYLFNTVQHYLQRCYRDNTHKMEGKWSSQLSYKKR